MPQIEHNLAKLTKAERDQLTARGWRNRRLKEWPPVAADVRPSNYIHDLDRGTIEYDATWGNYSYHKVQVPSGTIISGGNFSQLSPRTEAIIVVGLPDVVTFIRCNLTNIKIHSGWIIQKCNTSQSWLVQEDDPEESAAKIEVRQWIAAHPDDLPGILTPPLNVIISRGF